MNELIKEIRIAIEREYDIGRIDDISKLNLTFSKFTKDDHHFIIKTSSFSFFLKRYDVANLNRIESEIKSVSRFRNVIKIPTIIKNRQSNDYTIYNNSIFILYEYVDAPCLDNDSKHFEMFFSILCDIETKLIESKPKDFNSFSFQFRLEKFESGARDLLRILADDKRPNVKRDIEYVNFLVKEVEDNKSKILNLKIEKNYIHGDFLMQNVIKDLNDVVWILDWEKSREYITSIDILKSITFTLFDPKRDSFNLVADEMVKWTKFCFEKIGVSKLEVQNAFDLYYFHYLTGIDFLTKFYIENQDLNEKMIEEDFWICQWFKIHKDEMQLKLNEILA